MSISCWRKKTYPTEATANAVVFRLRANGVDGVAAYKCATCEKWHVGRAEGSSRQVA